MASAAMMRSPGPAPAESFLGTPPYGGFSARISFSHDFLDGDNLQKMAASPPLSATRAEDDADLDFEFLRVDDLGAMLTADELFSDGKLLPARQLGAPALVAPPLTMRSLAAEQAPQQKAAEESAASDSYAAFSPKAPTCTSQWRELLRRRRAAKNAARSEAQMSSPKCTSSSSTTSDAAVTRSLKLRHLLHRSLNRPSSPVAAGHHERPRLSLDADKPGEVSGISNASRQPARARLAPPVSGEVSQPPAPAGRTGRRPTRRTAGERSASVDSPRMNPSGKVVFQGLGRSSSSPSSLHGGGAAGARGRHRAAEAVRVAPVINVPVSVFGLGQLFSSSAAAAQRRVPSIRSASSGGALRPGGSGKTDRA